MNSCQYIAELEESLPELDRWLRALEQEIAEPSPESNTERSRSELEAVRKLRSARIEALEEFREMAAQRPPRPVSLEDIKHCQHQHEVLYIVARRNQGTANLQEAAQLIADGRMSSATRDSIRATLHHYVTDHDDWTHLGGGMVQLLTFREQPTEPSGDGGAHR